MARSVAVATVYGLERLADLTQRVTDQVNSTGPVGGRGDHGAAGRAVRETPAAHRRARPPEL